jgi:hypothetical protein
MWRAECRIKDSVIKGEIMNKEESISINNHDVLRPCRGSISVPGNNCNRPEASGKGEG